VLTDAKAETFANAFSSLDTDKNGVLSSPEMGEEYAANAIGGGDEVDVAEFINSRQVDIATEHGDDVPVWVPAPTPSLGLSPSPLPTPLLQSGSAGQQAPPPTPTQSSPTAPPSVASTLEPDIDDGVDYSSGIDYGEVDYNALGELEG
jgi:hypothetical protein